VPDAVGDLEVAGGGWGGTRGLPRSARTVQGASPEEIQGPDLLVAEVRDTIDQLNGRPHSTGRCLAAVETFLANRTEENRAAARTAFLAIPVPQRRYALGAVELVRSRSDSEGPTAEPEGRKGRTDTRVSRSGAQTNCF
jgi:hypothetical protein